MGATHFLVKTLPRVAAEMALHVLAYNLTRIMNIVGVRPLLAAMRAQSSQSRSRRLESASGAVPDRKGRQTRQDDQRRRFAEIASRQCFCQGVFTQPR
jgi:hypothetical protein